MTPTEALDYLARRNDALDDAEAGEAYDALRDHIVELERAHRRLKHYFEGLMASKHEESRKALGSYSHHTSDRWETCTAFVCRDVRRLIADAPPEVVA